MASSSGSFPVHGTVSVKDGKATLTLGPSQAADVKVTMTRPSSASLLERFEGGVLNVHASRLPLTKTSLTNIMGAIQRQLLLQPGASGVWNQECLDRLEALLSKPHGKAKVLAIED